ncbi:DUF5631 domain-containing protein [Mycobacterium shigaense]|uniref:DUF5631 domain-containing protein n=1 Tax=Mycobacterium shigaense TaxID=722731 RepID=UPI002ADFBCF3|nr:DUF5631 domain-containing protein [Mycobacterium shigaense]MEA1124875.1 DUF5631 domain-containing protein [Mycobacterium shigaense]
MNFPDGDWSIFIVGDQWPYDGDLAALSHGGANRGQIKSAYEHFSDILRSAQSGPLAPQQGHTAEDLRNAFQRGEKQAREIALKNAAKEAAYSAAYESMVGLQHALTNVANEANQQIKDIQKSKQPVAAKVPQIVETIHRYRAQANILGAKYGGNVSDAMQSILNADNPGQSARQFVQSHGLDMGQMFRQPDDQKNLEEQVTSALGKGGSSTGPANVYKNPLTPPKTAPPDASDPLETVTQVSNLPPTGPAPLQPRTVPAQSTKSLNGIAQAGFEPKPSPVSAPPAPPAAPVQSPAAPSMPHGGGSMPGSPLGGGIGGGAPTAPTSGLMGAPTSPTAAAPQGATPGELMRSFDKGLQAGSAGAGAIPPAQMAHADPQVPPSPATTPMAGAGVPTVAQAYDAPPPITHTSAPETAAPQMVTGPTTAAGPATAASAPSSALPAYASDIRPAAGAPTAPAAPPSLPPSMTPGSAPVHPSAGQGGTGTPTVVRHAPTPPPPSSPSSLGTESVAATATGAVAGAASADATARARLQRLVSAVARQQPRLAWAAGDRPDNTTVLATDLASGWIPPGIEIPAAVTLLNPERRRGDLETLLGEVSVAAGYTPIHHIPEADDEPIPTSKRPRHVPEIDELGWELSQATQWRDGLPRLAHTLAKATSGGTGVLDKEVELLHDHLAAVSSRVLGSYPDNVDAHDVGNWQLLAAIDALVAGDKSTATYHLAWFKACNSTITPAP